MATQRPKARPCPRGKCSEHRIAIDAPASRVWDVLADFGGWDTWNPLYGDTEGALAPGNTVTMAVKLDGMKPQTAAAMVSTFDPPKLPDSGLIEYGMRNFAGLLRIHRYVELTPTGPASCRVSNGEIMSGPVGMLMAKFMRGKIRKGLRGMNEGLKARAESMGPA